MHCLYIGQQNTCLPGIKKYGFIVRILHLGSAVEILLVDRFIVSGSGYV